MITRSRRPDREAPAPLPVDARGRTLPNLANPAAPLLEVENLVTHFELDGATVHAVDGRVDDGLEADGGLAAVHPGR